jgi:hypothetical protein
VKVRREESFQSENHRRTMEAHEIHKMYNKWDYVDNRNLDLKLAGVDAYWRTRDNVETEVKKEQETKRIAKAVKRIQFTDREIAIANKVFNKKM